MLIDRFGNLDLKNVLKTPEEFEPFPRYGDREGWARVLPGTRKAWLDKAEEFKDYNWPAVPTGKYLHFQRTGENLTALHRFWERRSALGILAIAECIEGGGRYLDQIVSGVYTICEETVWLTPFDLGPFKQNLPAPEDRIVNLVTGETGAELAWVWYLFRYWFEATSPRIGQRILREVTERLIVPYLAHDDYWWMGFVPMLKASNWNPWCNRNMLMCALLMDVGAETRAAVVHKAMRSLDRYLMKYQPDGCCDEGPMYWGAAGGGLHVCLELLKKASGGVIDIFDVPIVRAIGQYIYKAFIHGDWFVDFADGDAHVKVGATAYNYGRSIGDGNLVRLGASAQASRPVVLNWFGAYEYLLNIFEEEECARANTGSPYDRDGWMWHTQVMMAREREGGPQGLYLACKAGYNGEAHNHNDVGNFIVYADGNPVLIDLGTEEYSAKTFSPQRYELWYLQSQYHNCPMVGGVMQHDGIDYAAKDVEYAMDDGRAEMKADIAGAYPREAGIERWTRTCRLNRGGQASVEIIDDYSLEKPADVAWSLITPLAPQTDEPGTIALEYAEGKKAVVGYDAGALTVSVEKIDFMESRLRGNWGDVMYRVLLREITPQKRATRNMAVSLEG